MNRNNELFKYYFDVLDIKMFFQKLRKTCRIIFDSPIKILNSCSLPELTKQGIFLLGLLFPTLVFSSESKNSYVFGVFPHVPKSKLYDMYSPVAIDFQKKLNKKVLVRTKSSYNEFETSLASEIFDIALIQPFNYPNAHDKHNYLPIARRSDKLSALLIVKKNSNYKTLADLKNKVIASTAKTAAVSRLMEQEIMSLGFKPNKDFVRVYKNNHFSCIQSLLIGMADACSTSHRALDHYYQVKLKDKFRIVHESKKIPHVLYVVHKRVPETDRDILKKTILNWQSTETGKKILEKSRMSFFSEATNEEYDSVRLLALE